jgi:hypothetical protein
MRRGFIGSLHRRTFASALLLSTTLSLSCMYSKPFAMPEEWAQKLYEKARRDVYPDDVRRDPQAYAGTLVAWAGVVKSSKVVQLPHGPALVLVVTHHYFDWIEDHGAQKEIYLLSPRGEGDFVIATPIELDRLEYARKEAPDHVGKMLVAVGKPDAELGTENHVVFASAAFIVFEDKPFRTDWIDYGRPGEPMKRVEGGMLDR